MNKSLIATIFGFVGFSVGCVFLFTTCGKQKSSFHEIEYNPVQLARMLLKDKREFVSKEKARHDSLLKKKQLATPPADAHKKRIFERELNSFQAAYKRDSTLLSQINLYFEANAVDSAFRIRAANALYSPLALDTLTRLNADTSIADTIRLSFAFNDKAISGEETSGVLPLGIKEYSDIDFFAKYPGFGVWGLLIIIFFSCIFVLPLYCIDANSSLSELAASGTCPKSWPYIAYLLICAALLTVFLIVMRYSFYDSDPIRDLYFMFSLSDKVFWLSVMGYASAAFCFAGMLRTASHAECFKSKPELLQEFNDIFQRFFYSIALLLALLVFCTGSLYSAVNELEFAKWVNKDLGFQPTRYDFVYLYGGLHTLLILLFYLPAKLVMPAVKPAADDVTGEDPKKQTLLGRLSAQLKNLTDLMVASAPLLASFVQWLLNLIFEG